MDFDENPMRPSCVVSFAQTEGRSDFNKGSVELRKPLGLSICKGTV
jgi:hypothetical protein